MVMQEKKILVRLKRSYIGYSRKQRRILQSLGLRKINSFVVKDCTPAICGMIRKVVHLVEVKEVSE